MADERKASELAEFLSAAGTVPTAMSLDLRSRIEAELRPSRISIFAKISLIQFVVGGITLLFCPQFGISFTSQMGLMSVLMRFGDTACMLGCGALFMSASLFASSIFLRPEEVRGLRSSSMLQLLALSTLSLGTLICLGGAVVALLGLVWLVGAFLGGLLSLELGWRLRLRHAGVGS